MANAKWQVNDCGNGSRFEIDTLEGIGGVGLIGCGANANIGMGFVCIKTESARLIGVFRKGCDDLFIDTGIFHLIFCTVVQQGLKVDGDKRKGFVSFALKKVHCGFFAGQKGGADMGICQLDEFTCGFRIGKVLILPRAIGSKDNMTSIMCPLGMGLVDF